jgi:secreted trypsin-like serine protease
MSIVAFATSCSDPAATCGRSRHSLRGGEATADTLSWAPLVHLPSADAAECTGIAIEGGWILTAAHCAVKTNFEFVLHPELDVALILASNSSRMRLELLTGSAPRTGSILAFETLEVATADESPIGERVVEAEVSIVEATDDVVVAPAAGVVSVCEGDSGSPLLDVPGRSDDGSRPLIGILSTSGGANEQCTPEGAGQYWVRLAAAIPWLEQFLGECREVVSSRGVSCIFDASVYGEHRPGACQ